MISCHPGTPEEEELTAFLFGNLINDAFSKMQWGFQIPNLSANSYPDLPFPTQDFCSAQVLWALASSSSHPNLPGENKTIDIPVEETSCMEAEWHGTRELKLSWSLNYQAVLASTARQVEIGCQMVAAHSH